MSRFAKVLLFVCLAVVMLPPLVAALPLEQGADFATITPANLYQLEIVATLAGEYSAAFTPDGRYILTEGFTHVDKWEIEAGKSAAYWDNDSNVRALVMSPTGKLVAIIDDEPSIALWDVTTGKTVRTLEGHTDQVNSVAFSADGQLVASSSDDQSIRIWNVDAGTVNSVINTDHAILSVAFSPDATRLASGAWGDYVKVWDIQTGKEVLFLGQVNVHSLVFSPDGKRLAAAGDDVVLWDVTTGDSIAELRGRTVAISPDGSMLATTSDEVVWLWDAVTGSPLATLIGHGTGVWGAVFSPDGQYLASLGWHIIQLWGVPSREASPAQERSGIVLKSSGDYVGPFVALVPADRLVLAEESPRYELQLISLATNIQSCTYTIGTLTRRRIDVRAVLIDLDSGEQVAAQDFMGGEPGECRQTENLSLMGGNYRTGTAPTTEAFEVWISDTLAGLAE